MLRLEVQTRIANILKKIVTFVINESMKLTVLSNCALVAPHLSAIEMPCKDIELTFSKSTIDAEDIENNVPLELVCNLFKHLKL